MVTTSIRESLNLYGSFWRKSEKGFLRDVVAPERQVRLAALERSAAYFKVARNFALAYDVKRGRQRLSPVLEILDEYRETVITETTLVPIVTAVRRRLADAYNMNDLLSAATKFLWLLHRDPVVIFDSNVRTALNAPYGDRSEERRVG